MNYGCNQYLRAFDGFDSQRLKARRARRKEALRTKLGDHVLKRMFDLALNAHKNVFEMS